MELSDWLVVIVLVVSFVTSVLKKKKENMSGENFPPIENPIENSEIEGTEDYENTEEYVFEPIVTEEKTEMQKMDSQEDLHPTFMPVSEKINSEIKKEISNPKQSQELKKSNNEELRRAIIASEILGRKYF